MPLRRLLGSGVRRAARRAVCDRAATKPASAPSLFLRARFLSGETGNATSEADALLSTLSKDDLAKLQNSSQLPGTIHGGPKMAVVFTCTVCNTRSARQFSKQSYEEGVVLIRCPGCDNLHLFADRLGWFDDESVDIETIMREKGEEVGWVTSDEGIEFTADGGVGAAPLTPTPTATEV